jgi:hypothetical protein
MTIPEPYPADLVRIAHKVVWYDSPERSLSDLRMFLAHLMVYGAPDVAVAEQYISREEFRDALEHAPAGVFTEEAWASWHRRFGMVPVPPLPRRHFPDGSVGPEPGHFFGR